jgi:hypothetical protein
VVADLLQAAWGIVTAPVPRSTAPREATTTCGRDGHVVIRGLDRCFRCQEPFVLSADVYVTEADCALLSSQEIEGLFVGVGGLWAAKPTAGDRTL